MYKPFVNIVYVLSTLAVSSTALWAGDHMRKSDVNKKSYKNITRSQQNTGNFNNKQNGHSRGGYQGNPGRSFHNKQAQQKGQSTHTFSNKIQLDFDGR